MKNKTNKKNRINKVDSYFKTLEDGVYKVIFNPETGLELRNKSGILVNPSEVNSQLYYNSESRPKILSFGKGGLKPYNNPSLILKNHKYLCAIDTNTRIIHGRLVSVSVACLGLWEDLGAQTKFIFNHEYYMDTFDYNGKHELFAWRKFIELIVKGQNYSEDETFGIIVDSELGEIPEINRRELPLYEDYYLPEKMYLIYASADKSDTLQNKIIKTCDELATERLNFLEKRYTLEDFKKK